MREKDIFVAHVYASPSLRCVESACSLLQGMLLYTVCCLQIYYSVNIFVWISSVVIICPKFVHAFPETALHYTLLAVHARGI